MLCMTGNCIGPRSSSQIILAGLGIFVGAIISANVFGELAITITSLQQKSIDFQQKMTQVNTTNLRLPSEI
jgi:hypothetical protein